jgi:GDPmannose 4,6-dehydratase
VSYNVARIKLGLQKKLKMGNLEAERDWGFAGDYVRAMWLMLQQHSPDDYVVATGTAHSVKHLLELAFAHAGLDYRDHVEVAQDFLRPADVYHLRGDYTKARQQLGWEPHVSFEQMIEMMVDSDLELVARTTPRALSLGVY